MFAYLYIFCHVLIILPPHEKVADIFLDEYKAMVYLHEEVGIFKFNWGICKKRLLGCMMPGIEFDAKFYFCCDNRACRLFYSVLKGTFL